MAPILAILIVFAATSQAAHLSGTVVDEDGKPVVEASIDHSGDRVKAHLTDATGHFELETSGPSVVIRKEGFQSAFLQTQQPGEIRITSRKLNQNGSITLCKGEERQRFGGPRLQFQRIREVKVGPTGNGDDFFYRTYYVGRSRDRTSISHGNGATWSGGIPVDQDVWESAEYAETVWEVGAMRIIDARGRAADGSRWRYLGLFGESAHYRSVNKEAAATLDRFMDGACLNPTPRR